MPRYYKLDSRQVRWGEYRRLAADPVTLLVLSFCKLCRIPFQLMKGLPLHDSQAVNLLAEGELPEFVGRRWQPDLDRLIALGCHSPQVYGVRDNLTPTLGFVAAFLHPAGEAVARVLYARPASAPEAAAKVRTSFMSQLADGTSVTTSNGKRELDPAPDTLTVWHPEMPVEQLWQRHQERLAELRLRASVQLVRTPEELAEHHDQVERRAFENYIRRGLYVEMSAAEVEAMRRPATTTTAGALDENAPVLAELAALQNPKRSWISGLLLLGVTMAAFAAAGAWQWKPETALALLPILLFHEAGHYLAMRRFGYQNVQMFFIPFFGAAVSGLQLRAPAWKKAVVSLAGPLPGIALGAVLAVVATATGEKWLTKAATLLLILNGFNLLPFVPLDGGWLLNAVIFARHRWAETIFRALAALALIGIGLALGDRILPIVGAFMLLGLRQSHRIGEVTERLRQRNLPPDLPTAKSISPEYAVRILTETRAALPVKPVLPPKQLAQMVMSIYERLHTPAPGWGASVALLAAYLGGLLGSVIFASVLFAGTMHRKTARGDQPAVATVPYDGEAALTAGNRAALDATNRSLVIGAFKTVAAARNTFTNSQPLLAPNEALTQFGQSLVVTISGPVGEK